jgi:multiple sugar transport system substrate-binding protein
MRTRFGALLSTLALVVTACQGTAVSPSPGASAAAASAQPSASPAAGQKLTIWARNYTVAQDEPWKPAEAKFMAAHPNVTIDLSGAPYDPQFQRIELSQAGQVSDIPDIFQIDNIWLGQMTEEGIATNLDSYYANWADASDIADAYKESTKWNGSQHGVWWYSDIRLMIWNKDVFKKAGLDPEKGPTTWNELMADAQAIKDKVPGVSPIGFPAASEEGTVDRFYSYLYMTGSNILSADNKTAVFNDAGGQKALQLYVDLVKKGYTPKTVLSQTADDVSAAVFAGKYGIMLATVGDGLSDRPKGMTPDQYKATIGAALPPLCDGCSPATTAGGWMLIIDDKSPNKDLAWDMIKVVTDGKTMIPFEVQYTRVPVRKSGLAEAQATNAFQGDPYFAEEIKAAGVAHFPPFISKYTAMIETIWTAIQKAVNGDASPKDALDAAAKDTNTILAGQ